MIVVEQIENLDGSVAIPTEQLIYLKNSKLVTGGGTEIDISGSSSGGGGEVTPPPAEVQDLTLEYMRASVDASTDNTIEILQDSGQSNFSKYQMMVYQEDFNLTATAAGEFNLSKIKMNVNSAGYQIVKILLYDINDNMITFNRVDSDTVKRTTEATILVDFVSNGFMLVTNTSYELANILNTDKLPVAATGGWYALSTNTDDTASFTATFNSPVKVAKARIYRCGAASTSFNGGTNDYTLKFIDSTNVEIIVSVPKVADAVFTSISNPTIAPLATSGGIPTLESKLKNFNLSMSTDGITFTDITSEGIITTSQNPTTLAYSATETFPIKTIDSSKLYFKIPDEDISFLKSVKIFMWRKS